MKKESNQANFLIRLSTFIVNKRNGIFLLYIVMCLISFFSMRWVGVNNDITSYLDESTEIKQGLNISDAEFKDYAMAKVMVSNITYETAEIIHQKLELIKGIYSVNFDGSKEYYTNSSALFLLSFDAPDHDELSHQAMQEVLDKLRGYDVYVDSTLVEDKIAQLQEEMSIILVVAVIIIIGVLIFTSRTFAEIIVLLMTFTVSAILNMGSHFIFGEISFVSNSVAIVLQLALGVDYAIILCHRFSEEREQLDAHDAAILALSKAIPEVSSSSLTTISGLMALMFMQFHLGYDMGLVLIKAVLLSLLVVFTLMPGLLVIFSKLMDKTKHRNFVPSINKWGQFVIKTKRVIPIVFMIIILAGAYLSSKTDYVYGNEMPGAAPRNAAQFAKAKIKNTFGADNPIGVIIPSGDYEQEARLIKELESMEGIKKVIGLSNTKGTEDIENIIITKSMTPREFAELTDMDIENVEMLYSAYAINEEKYARIINGLSEYRVPLIDMFIFIYEQKEDGYITLDDTMDQQINDAYRGLQRGKNQLQSGAYSRIIILADFPEEGHGVFDKVDKVKKICESYYEDVHYIGASISDKDLASSFDFDNRLISVLSALFVMLVLMFTFRSSGLPVLLILCIQGGIWINFTYPYLTDTSIQFIGYLVVVSIQMGATIDYAIVITSRYMELKKVMAPQFAIMQSLDLAFPTIITSGTILSSSALLIGEISSDFVVATLGSLLGRGTLISMFIVMGVLPQMLLVGDKLIERTAFEQRKPSRISQKDGSIRVDGRIRGHINGYVDGILRGKIDGEIDGIMSDKRGENNV